MRVLLAFAALATPLCAADQHALYGIWGTPHQCAQLPIIEGGTKRAHPFEITEGWLRHGDVWCRLTWFPVQTRPDGLFAGTQALCGEDSSRAYRLDFALTHQELTLIWDTQLANGPLRRCE